MKIGKNIAQAREARGLSQQSMAAELKIDLTEFKNIEDDQTDITLARLADIADYLSCSPIFLLQYRESGGSIYNHFDNSGNHGTNIHIQGIDQEEIRKAYKELYKSELERIPKLEKLLRSKNIEFDF